MDIKDHTNSPGEKKRVSVQKTKVNILVLSVNSPFPIASFIIFKIKIILKFIL